MLISSYADKSTSAPSAEISTPLNRLRDAGRGGDTHICRRRFSTAARRRGTRTLGTDPPKSSLENSEIVMKRFCETFLRPNFSSNIISVFTVNDTGKLHSAKRVGLAVQPFAMLVHANTYHDLIRTEPDSMSRFSRI